MARRSDIEQQIADLQAQLENADTDDEVWIKEGNREIKVTGRRATSVLEKFKDLWDSAGDGGDGDGDGDEGDGDDDAGEDPKPKGGGYFSKRPRKG